MKKREKSWNPHTFYCDRSECHSVFLLLNKNLLFARFSCWLRKHLETLTSQGSLLFSYLAPQTGLCPSSTIAATSFLPFRASIRSRKSSRARMWTPGSPNGCSPAAWWRPYGRASKTSWKWVRRPLRDESNAGEARSYQTRKPPTRDQLQIYISFTIQRKSPRQVNAVIIPLLNSW